MKRPLVWLIVVSFLAAACGGGDSSSGGDGGGSRPGAATVDPFSPAPPSPPVTVPTQPGNYNYSPAIIDEGGVIKAWWCSAVPDAATDEIWYQEYDKATKKWSRLQSVLKVGRPGEWDTFGVCHPSVIRGSWPGAPGGQNFTYAMYYTSTNDAVGGGANNSTGVVFSTDGTTWSGQHAKHNPMIVQKVPNVRGTYGAGLPSAWSRGGSEVTLFWIDTTAEKVDDPNSPDGHASRMFMATSSDGIKFSSPKVLTKEGAPAYWKNDLAFDDSVQPPMVYSAQAIQFRPAEPPAKVETFNFGFYRIPMDQLLAGGGRWEQLGVVDTNLTGLPLNFEPGLVRTGSGKVATDVDKEGLQVWFGGGGQVPTTWGLRSLTFRLGKARLALRRYSAGAAGGAKSQWVTTGFVPPSFRGEAAAEPVTLGYLDNVPAPGEVALYGCQKGPLSVTPQGELTDAAADRFVSLDASCEGAQTLGTNGYLFPQAPPGVKTRPLYACRSPRGRFVSNDPKCEGEVTERLLGYASAEA